MVLITCFSTHCENNYNNGCDVKDMLFRINEVLQGLRIIIITIFVLFFSLYHIHIYMCVFIYIDIDMAPVL